MTEGGDGAGGGRMGLKGVARSSGGVWLQR